MTLNIDARLMRRMQRAIFRCPGFTESQKDDVAFITNADAHKFGLAPYADHWCVFMALGPKRSAETDLLIVSPSFCNIIWAIWKQLTDLN
jgi:hypothetical protein